MSELEKLRNCIIDRSEPIAKRTHASFILRTMGTENAAAVLCEALCQRNDSSLLRHELAYILGQMQYAKFCPELAAILECETEDPLVRHEAAEAIGAIGDESYLRLLSKYIDYPVPEIAETCQIAIDLINFKVSRRTAAELNGTQLEKRVGTSGSYLSEDPAPPLEQADNSHGVLSVDNLRVILNDTQNSLFVRYRAMFSLRNMNNDASALALTTGFSDKSALFRHEVAYVLGQMQRAVTIPALKVVLADVNEHKMVRHEAAEALGAIGGNVVEEILKEYQVDSEDVVRESAVVALDTMDYWANF